MNKEFIEKLKSQAEEISAFKFGTIIGCINALLERANEDKIYVIRYNGKEIYSFMTEEEMYQIMLNKSKEEYLQEEAKRQKEIEEDEAREKAECEEALKTKFPKYKKIYEECYPKEKAQRYTQGVEKELKEGFIYGFYHLEEKVKLLEAARTLPAREVEKLYYQETDSQNRLYNYHDLINSYYADVFLSVIIDDYVKFKNSDGKLTEKEIDEIILDLTKKAREAKALAVEAFKKQDFKAVLRARIQKPVEAARKRDADQKASNNLDVLLGGETSEKGKTQKGSQKD